MEIKYSLPVPYITKASKYQEEFLTPKEFRQAFEQGFIKGKKLNTYSKNRCSISMYLGDDAKNLSRPIYVNFKGYSNYGISKFRGKGKEGEEPEEKTGKKDKDDKEKKKKLGSWSIAFNVEENPHLVEIANSIDNYVKDTIKPMKKKLYEYFSISDTDNPLTFRRCARASSGSTIKNFRLTIRPGKCELGSAKDFTDIKSLSEFTQDTPGDYKVVMHFDHIDISYEKDVVSVGPILYASIIRSDFSPKLVLKRKFRDDDDEAVGDSSLTQKPRNGETETDTD